MKVEAKWEGAGFDQISLQMLMDMGEDGYEFIIDGGHIISVLWDM